MVIIFKSPYSLVSRLNHFRDMSHVYIGIAGIDRQTSTRDYIICFNDGVVGFAQKYISVCCKDCTSCRLPCTHAVIAEVFEKLDCEIITDSITGATARQIQCIDESRWIVLLLYVMYVYSSEPVLYRYF